MKLLIKWQMTKVFEKDIILLIFINKDFEKMNHLILIMSYMKIMLGIYLWDVSNHVKGDLR